MTQKEFFIVTGVVKYKVFVWIFDRKFKIKGRFPNIGEAPYYISAFNNQKNDTVAMFVCRVNRKTINIGILDPKKMLYREIEDDKGWIVENSAIFFSGKNLFICGIKTGKAVEDARVVLKVINLENGSARVPFSIPLSESPHPWGFNSYALSPNEKKLAFTISSGKGYINDVWIVDLSTMKTEKIVTGNRNFPHLVVQQWASDHRVILTAKGDEAYGVDLG